MIFWRAAGHDRARGESARSAALCSEGATSISRRTRGYILIPVVLMLTVVATVSFLVSFEGGMNTVTTARELEVHEGRFVAEAGYGEAKWILSQNTTCAGYADLPATTFGSHSYSVAILPTSGSPVTLTSTSVLSTGARNVLRKESISYQAPTLLTLQPGAEGEDTYLWDGAHKNTNFGASSILSINNASAERTSLLRFDLSALPPGRVLSANLELYLEGGNSLNSGVLDLHAVTRNWFEGVEDDAPPGSPGATYNAYDGSGFPDLWTTPGGDYEPTPLASTTIAGLVPGFYQWDITNLVSAWRAGSPNYGVLLRAAGSGNVDKVDFTSGDGAPASRRPKLTITYACECGVVCTPLPGSGGTTIILSTDSNATLGGLAFENIDLVEYGPTTDTATLFFDGSLTTLNTDISAVHVLANGHIVLSPDGDTELGGIEIGSGDLADYDPATDTATLIFDGSVRFNDDFAKIVSVHVKDDGHFILSTEGDEILAGLSFEDIDLVEYDPTTDTATLFFDGSLTTLNTDISAVHVLDNGHIILSPRNDAELGGLEIGQDDLADYDPVNDTATLVFEGSTLFDNTGEAIVSAHIGPGSGAVGGGPGDPPPPGGTQPFAHWKLDDGAGPTALDSRGGHTGTLEQGPVWTDVGQIDGALRFDGIDDRILVPHSDLLSMSSDFTISAWIRNDSPSFLGSDRILSKESSGANDNYWLGLENGGLVLGVGGAEFQASVKLEPDQWYHVAASFDAEYGGDPNVAVVRMYVDGVPALAEKTLAALTPNTSPIYIGANWEPSKYWNGLLDDVRLDNVALGPDEIAILADPGGGGGDLGSCDETISDDFESEDYTGDTGTLPWSTFWLEVNESDGPDSGDSQVDEDQNSRRLRVSDNDKGGEGVQREADLSKFTRATLSFEYRRNGLDNAEDYIMLQMSSDGGSSWTEIQRFPGPDNDAEYQSATHDISSFIAPNTRIRFFTSPDLGRDDKLFIDNLEFCIRK